MTAKLPQVRASMEHAAEEESTTWLVEQRIAPIGQHPGANPLFYGLSFGIGAAAGLSSDKSLGFVAATTSGCKHLDEHLTTAGRRRKIPGHSEQMSMMKNNKRKAHWMPAASASGPVRFGMSLLAKVMTKALSI